MDRTIDIKVNYVLHIPEEYFDRIYKHACELGYSFNDAGPKETIRRMLMSDGIDEINEVTRTPDCSRGRLFNGLDCKYTINR